MDEIRLLKPTMEYEKDIMQFREELINANDNDSFAGCGSLRRCTTVEEWLETWCGKIKEQNRRKTRSFALVYCMEYV